MTLAGLLVSVAASIGLDDQNTFPYTNLAAFTDTESYRQTVQEQAHGAIDRLMWCIPAGNTAPRAFLAVFPKITAPNPTQDAAITHAARLAICPIRWMRLLRGPRCIGFHGKRI